MAYLLSTLICWFCVAHAVSVPKTAAGALRTRFIGSTPVLQEISLRGHEGSPAAELVELWRLTRPADPKRKLTDGVLWNDGSLSVFTTPQQIPPGFTFTFTQSVTNCRTDLHDGDAKLSSTVSRRHGFDLTFSGEVAQMIFEAMAKAGWVSRSEGFKETRSGDWTVCTKSTPPVGEATYSCRVRNYRY